MTYFWLPLLSICLAVLMRLEIYGISLLICIRCRSTGLHLYQNLMHSDVLDSTTPDDLLTFLQSLGHNVTTVPSLGVCSAVQYLDGKITFHGDKRDEEDAAEIY